MTKPDDIQQPEASVFDLRADEMMLGELGTDFAGVRTKPGARRRSAAAGRLRARNTRPNRPHRTAPGIKRQDLDRSGPGADLLDAGRQGARPACIIHPTPIVPRDVKRVIEFIHANFAATIDVASLVAVANVSGRALFQHFHDFMGVPPMRYLRDVRLEHVREELARGGRVTEAALRCGFTHLGRFASAYRHRFGESPSTTVTRVNMVDARGLLPI